MTRVTRATIADNVGDNVGDVAGMGADLFESYVGSIIGTMVLGTAFLTSKAVMADSAFGELERHHPAAGVLAARRYPGLHCRFLLRESERRWQPSARSQHR